MISRRGHSALRILSAISTITLLVSCTSPRRPSVTQRDSARIPDRAGLVQDITFEWLILDGKRHDLDPYVEVVSSYDTSITVSLIETKAHYVHLGLDEGDVLWISVLGVPFGDPARILYVGIVERVIDSKRFILEDGTVLQASREVKLPASNQRIRVLIDPTVDLVVEISPN